MEHADSGAVTSSIRSHHLRQGLYLFHAVGSVLAVQFERQRKLAGMRSIRSWMASEDVSAMS